MASAALILRLGLAGILIPASVGKFARPRELAAVVEPYGKFGPVASWTLGFGFASIEAATAVLLVIAPTAGWGLGATAALFSVFALVTWRVVRKEKEVVCNCLGAGVLIRHDEFAAFANAGVACLALVALAKGGTQLALGGAGTPAYAMAGSLAAIAYWVGLYARSVLAEGRGESRELVADL